MKIIIGHDIRNYEPQILFVNGKDNSRIFFDLSDSGYAAYKEHILSYDEIKKLIKLLQDEIDLRKDNVD